jgi:hypothetical protein
MDRKESMWMHKKIVIVIISFIFSLLQGCAAKFAMNDLCGAYEAHYTYGTEKLVLNQNGKYQQLFTSLKGNLLVKNRGQWSIDNNNLLLENAVSIDNGFGELSSKLDNYTNSFLRVSSFLNSVSLNFDDDLGVVFNRLSNEECK